MPEPCPICGNSKNNKTHEAREMMFGTRDPFEYLECGSCGTLSLLRVPDLPEYYPKDYYSFRSGRPELTATLKRRIAARFIGRYLVTGRGIVGEYLSKRRTSITAKFPKWLRDLPTPVRLDSSVLDYGCGAGEQLKTLNAFGFSDLTGADPFIEHDLYLPGIKIHKKRFEDLERRFDLVMLHHSFEHLPDPERSLLQINRLLAENGTVLIRIPVVNYAWERYGVNWVQLDPPRHLFLYTEQAFRMLTEKAGFSVAKVVYDSEAFQFHGSEQYAMDIPMNDPRTFRGANDTSIFTQEQYDDWREQAVELNEEGRGDQACFYLRRATETEA